MYFSTTTLAAAAAAATAATASPLVARQGCAIQYPASLGFPINYNVSAVREDAVSFQLPPGATGCSLIVEFPAGYPVETSAGAGDDEVNFLNATTKAVIAAGVPIASLPDQVSRITVTIGLCYEVMEYTLQYATANDGYVAFSEIEGAGFMMEYDCGLSA